MKFIYFNILLLIMGLYFVSTSCTGARRNTQLQSSQEQYVQPDSNKQAPVTLTPPPSDKETRTSSIYIESISKVAKSDTAFLVIKGNYPNGCTQLSEVKHRVDGDTLHIYLSGWQPADKICTQALIPFVYHYAELPSSEVRRLTKYVVDGKAYSF